MNRIKPYDVPHKGLRNALSQLSLLAGSVDYSKFDDVQRLYNLGAEVFELLDVHARDENDVTLAELETRSPGASKHDMDDHEQIHLAQNKLEELLSKMYNEAKTGKDVTEDGEEFYLAFSEFQASYLKHIAEEERVTQQIIWQHFTDNELVGHRGKIMGALPPQTLLKWFKYVIPAQSHNERVGLFSGFKKMAPEPFFLEGMNVVQQVLPENEFNDLQSQI